MMEPVDVRQAWPEAAPLIEAALRGSDDSAAEVLSACDSGRACMLGSERVFAVVEPVACAPGFDLLIWVAVSRGARDCIAAHLIELEDLARRMGARRLAFRSSRRGFERVLPPGWAVRQVVWAKDCG